MTRVAALDHAAENVLTRAERLVALLAGCAIGFGLVGWALGRDWER